MPNQGFDDSDVIGHLLAAADAGMADSWISRVGLLVGSDSAEETHGFLGAVPGLREWVGERQLKVMNREQHVIRNKKYEGSMEVPETHLSRDKTGLLQRRLSSFGAECGASHWQELLADLINAGGSGTGYDGVAFFSASHVMGASGTLSNLLTASDYASLNVGTATAPTGVEFATALLDVVGHFMTYRNDQGKLINGSARSFVVAVATPPLFSAATQAITSMAFAGGADNPVNGLKQSGYRFEVVMDNRLTSATAKMRVFRADAPIPAFLLQEERALRVKMLGLGSEHHVKTDNILIAADAIRGAGYGDPLTAIDATFS